MVAKSLGSRGARVDVAMSPSWAASAGDFTPLSLGFLSGGVTGAGRPQGRGESITGTALSAGTVLSSELSRGGEGIGVAFQAPPGSQASSRGEAKDSALLSSRDAGLLEPPERPQGSTPAQSVTPTDV